MGTKSEPGFYQALEFSRQYGDALRLPQNSNR